MIRKKRNIENVFSKVKDVTWIDFGRLEKFFKAYSVKNNEKM